jgi:hypothetical protein
VRDDGKRANSNAGEDDGENADDRVHRWRSFDKETMRKEKTTAKMQTTVSIDGDRSTKKRWGRKKEESGQTTGANETGAENKARGAEKEGEATRTLPYTALPTKRDERKRKGGDDRHIYTLGSSQGGTTGTSPYWALPRWTVTLLYIL